VDIAIIGAGFTGLSTAYNLLKDSPGVGVAVLEAEVVVSVPADGMAAFR